MKKFLFVIIVFALFFVACRGSGRRGPDDSRFDRASKECATCHGAERFVSGVHEPHIVGLDYRSISEKDPTLTGADTLDSALRLIDGKISCVTCHVEYFETEHSGAMLTVDNRESRLCMKCHKK